MKYLTSFGSLLSLRNEASITNASVPPAYLTAKLQIGFHRNSIIDSNLHVLLSMTFDNFCLTPKNRLLEAKASLWFTSVS